MERKQIRDNLVRLLKAQIEDISVNETIEDEEPLENYGINSVAILKILVNIEKVFPISIDDDDFDEMLYDDSEEPSYLYSFICPNCGNEIEVDEQTMENEQEIVCPECSNTIPVGTADVDELKF